jgi:phage terminase small subunit
MRRLKNPRHERFCHEYLKDLNATAAYLRTYPRAKQQTAENNGPRLLGNAWVSDRVAQLQQERAERTAVTADQVITELARIGFSDLREFVTWGPRGVILTDSDTLTEDQARCVAEVSETVGDKSRTRRFKLHDKVTALIKLGQHLGIKFVERHEHTGKDGADLPGPQVIFYAPDNGRGPPPLAQLRATVNGNGRR